MKQQSSPLAARLLLSDLLALPGKAVVDAAAVSAVAAVVDYACVPDRFTPGFEKRLAPASLLLVYGAFAAGLALSGLAALRRH